MHHGATDETPVPPLYIPTEAESLLSINSDDTNIDNIYEPIQAPKRLPRRILERKGKIFNISSLLDRSVGVPRSKRTQSTTSLKRDPIHDPLPEIPSLNLDEHEEPTYVFFRKSSQRTSNQRLDPVVKSQVDSTSITKINPLYDDVSE